MNLVEYRIWIDKIKADVNREEYEKMLKFSPHKFSLQNELDIDVFLKEHYKNRKIIHNKLLDIEAIERLKRIKIQNFEFNWAGMKKNTRTCICTKTFKKISGIRRWKFYETVNYNYIFIDGNYIIFNEKMDRIVVTKSEFSKNFIDYRIQRINEILG